MMVGKKGSVLTLLGVFLFLLYTKTNIFLIMLRFQFYNRINWIKTKLNNSVTSGLLFRIVLVGFLIISRVTSEGMYDRRFLLFWHYLLSLFASFGIWFLLRLPSFPNSVPFSCKILYFLVSATDFPRCLVNINSIYSIMCSVWHNLFPLFYWVLCVFTSFAFWSGWFSLLGISSSVIRTTIPAHIPYDKNDAIGFH